MAIMGVHGLLPVVGVSEQGYVHVRNRMRNMVVNCAKKKAKKDYPHMYKFV